MNGLRLSAVAVCALLFAGLLGPACSSSGETGAAAGGGDGSGAGGGSISEPVCLLHSCETDVDCGTCADGRTHCLGPQHACVECDPTTKLECPGTDKCSPAGRCIPKDLECPADENGVPTLSCDTDADCGACSADHQICDPITKTCVACTQDDTSECKSTDFCDGGGRCVAKCPETCAADADCSQCGAQDHPVHACNLHKCAECSATLPCPEGKTCSVHGVCQPSCGIAGQVGGTCTVDADCAGCEATATSCNTAADGGHGKCGPAVAGCADLGAGSVLPAPFDAVTSHCTQDADCSFKSAKINVGKLLRDLTGLDQIKDAQVSYSMDICAKVTIQQGEQCGICVPCRFDSDCVDIDVDQDAAAAFGPKGSAASKLLLDQVFGPKDHKIYMVCEAVGQGYGVCTPCPGLINECGGVGSGSGSCGHDHCTKGDALDPSCDACAAQVCAVDAYCCTNTWDDACVAAVPLYCSDNCATPGPDSCSHDQCTVGAALNASCSECVANVCNADAYCCQTAWDQQCVDAVTQQCPCATCNNTCEFACQCFPNGCLFDSTCGPCYADYDCFPRVCESGVCVDAG